MGNDIVFKTKAFGGYNKEDVMNYINGLLNEKKQIEEKLADSVSENSRLKDEISEMKDSLREIDSLKTEIESAVNLNDELKAQLESKESEIKNLVTEVSERDEKIVELENNVHNNSIDEETEKELEFLRFEVQRLKAENEKKKDIERQVGAAMLDARVHSEGLVEAAREKANIVTKSVYDAIGDTAVKIDDLSTGIGEIARSFTKSVEEVELRIKALTGDMSKTAQLLISETGVISDLASAEVEYDFTKKIGDNEEV